MGLEDDFWRMISMMKRPLSTPKLFAAGVKEKFLDDEFYYFLDLIDEYYSESGILDVQPDVTDIKSVDLEKS